MSSENFESLEDDFFVLKDKIKKRLDNDLSKMWGETRKNALQEVSRMMDDIQHVLIELEDEAKAAPLPYRSQMLSKVKTYNQELLIIKRKVSAQENNFDSTKHELLSKRDDIPNAENRLNHLMQINNTITRTNERVLNAQLVAAETDQVGTAVADELGTQRESLLRTKERLIDTDSNLTRSRKFLQSMYRKVVTNKLILIVIILFEFGILGGEVYYKFFV